MKKIIISAFCIICVITALPIQIFAYPHGYKRHTDEIYATVREGLTVYEDEYWEESVDYLPPFTGIKVTYVDGPWRKIEYTSKGETKTGWITSDEFYSSCLYYDGREKQSLADGDYLFYCSGKLSPEEAVLPAIHSDMGPRAFTFPLQVTFEGNKAFRILRTDTGQYLQADSPSSTKHVCHWGGPSHAGSFSIIRKDDYYYIRDRKTRYALCLDPSGILRFDNGQVARFKVTRTSGKVLDPKDLRVFAQYDASWANDYYGSADKKTSTSNNFCTSACGIFSSMNAIYTLTGQYIDPHILADYAVEKDFRVEDNGTDSGFFRSAARMFGKDYAFRFDGESGDLKRLKKKLLKGDVAIAHVPGHYVAIVDYNPQTKKFLLLDSHYLPKRKTCPYGDWVTSSVLEGDTNLYASMYYFFRPVK